MKNIENIDNLTIETIYKMVLEMKSKLDFLESETHVPQSDKAGLYMEGIELRVDKVEADIVEMKADIKIIEVRLGNVEADIVEMKADIKSIEVRLGNVEVEIAAMKADIAATRKDIANFISEQSKFRDDIYKWGVASVIGTIVSVSSIVGMVVIFMN